MLLGMPPGEGGVKAQGPELGHGCRGCGQLCGCIPHDVVVSQGVGGHKLGLAEEFRGLQGEMELTCDDPTNDPSVFGCPGPVGYTLVW